MLRHGVRSPPWAGAWRLVLCGAVGSCRVSQEDEVSACLSEIVRH